jgi:nucleotide-binding universal stress UspA family protein
MIRNLLVALDGSKRAGGVIRCAVELAEALGASLHLLRVVAIPPEFPPAGHVSHVDALPGYLLRQAEAQLLPFAEQTPHLQVEMSVLDSAQPWRAILETADRIGADMIVVGSHGYHGLDYLLGTNAGKVANLARRNVLVVHGQHEDPQFGSYRHVARPGERGSS